MESAQLTCSWPPTVEQRAHLAILGNLIATAGMERFLAERLVRADESDFPEDWEPTIACVVRLVHRMFWHAYLDPEITVEDVRPAGYDEKMLRTSEIEIAAVEDGHVTFHVASIGNDNVAGLLAHLVGEAFLELMPGNPFRDWQVTAENDPERGSIAACYLGFGVLVANSSLYTRHASRLAGNVSVSENRVEQTGGLSIADSTFLLAVQDVLHDDHQDALSTLLPPQAEWLARWIEVLEPHEEELRELLALSETIEARALTRPSQPSAPRPVEERDLSKFNAGHLTFRVPVRTRRWFAGASLGLLAAVGARIFTGEAVELLALVPIGAVVGLGFRKRGFQCADPECRRWMELELATCPGCGGEIAGSIKHTNQRLDRLDQIESERERD